MAKKLYVLNQGSYGSGCSNVWAIVETKKKAKEVCVAHGYKWSSYDQNFCNDKDQAWISVEVVVMGEVDTGYAVSYGSTKEQREEKKRYDEMCPYCREVVNR